MRWGSTFGAALMVALCVCSTSNADWFQGSITASFQDPVLTGNTLNPIQYFDNTNSAVSSTFESNGSEVFQWGANSASSPGYSNLIFTPNSNVNVSNNLPFDFGTVSFFNGTSELASLVFGVDLVLHFTGSPGNDTLIIPVTIGTTVNGSDAASSADFVTFGGINTSFFVYEGFGATATLYGSLVGNLQFSPDSLAAQNSFTSYGGSTAPLVPYDPTLFHVNDGFAGGFLAPAPSAVPEPSSLTILSIGGIGLAISAYRRRQMTTV